MSESEPAETKRNHKLFGMAKVKCEAAAPAAATAASETIDLTGVSDEELEEKLEVVAARSDIAQPDALPRPKCPRCNQEQLAIESPESLPATAFGYCELVQCACCLRMFAESDESAFSEHQRVRGGLLRRCKGCDYAGYMDLFHDLLRLNKADGVLRELEEAKETSGDDAVAAVHAQSRVVREAFGLDYHRAWLQHEQPGQDTVFTPQTGDDVVVFPHMYQAFMLYADIAFGIAKYEHAKFSNVIAAKCRVVDVEYIFPDANLFCEFNLVLSQVTLAVLAVWKEESEATGRRKRKRTKDQEAHDPFDFKQPLQGDFTNVNDKFSKVRVDGSAARRFTFKMLCCPRFLEKCIVLDSVFELGIRSGWQVGDRVQSSVMHLDEYGEPSFKETLVGPIVMVGRDVSSLNERYLDHIQRKILTVRVDWEGQEDEDEDDREVAKDIGPWELQHVDESRQHMALWRDNCCTSTRRLHSRRISDDAKQKLLMALDSIMEQRCYQYFTSLTDASVGPDYFAIVANPLDLRRVRARVQHGYYRQYEALLSDVQTIRRNTHEYERAKSCHVANADRLYAAVEEGVRSIWGKDFTAPGTEKLVYYPNEIVEHAQASTPRHLVKTEQV